MDSTEGAPRSVSVSEVLEASDMPGHTLTGHHQLQGHCRSGSSCADRLA
jgi:hypothetical protein